MSQMTRGDMPPWPPTLMTVPRRAIIKPDPDTPPTTPPQLDLPKDVRPIVYYGYHKYIARRLYARHINRLMRLMREDPMVKDAPAQEFLEEHNEDLSLENDERGAVVYVFDQGKYYEPAIIWCI